MGHGYNCLWDMATTAYGTWPHGYKWLWDMAKTAMGHGYMATNGYGPWLPLAMGTTAFGPRPQLPMGHAYNWLWDMATTGYGTWPQLPMGHGHNWL